MIRPDCHPDLRAFCPCGTEHIYGQVSAPRVLLVVVVTCWTESYDPELSLSLLLQIHGTVGVVDVGAGSGAH